MGGVEKNVALSPHTTLRVGGRAEYWAKAENEEEVAALAGFARQRRWPLHIIGAGSNVLVDDDGVKGLVIKIAIKRIDAFETDDDVMITAGAGEILDDLIKFTVDRDWWGLENLSAIPGTVGATPVQNVGAYGVEVSDLIDRVRVFDIEENEYRELSAAECRFGYRDSVFKSAAGERYIITAVTFRLAKKPAPRIRYKDLWEKFGDREDAPSIADVRAAIIDIRRQKFPDLKAVGTAGSFFKNPLVTAEKAADLKARWPDLPLFAEANGRVKVSLGYVLDKICGLRGAREGDIGLFERQALVLVNYGQASARDIIAFARTVSATVEQQAGLKIEWEVNLWK